MMTRLPESFVEAPHVGVARTPMKCAEIAAFDSRTRLGPALRSSE
jgi:hypothetical protein